jgi:hypothetical protein
MGRTPARTCIRFLSTALIVSGCNRQPDEPAAMATLEQPDSAVWTAATEWRLSQNPVVEIKGSDDNVENTPLDPVAVFQLHDGRYVVADGDQNGWHALLIYDDQGKFERQLGRKGQGPGEFVQLHMWAGRYPGDSIAALDFDGPSIEIFTPTGEHARAVKLPKDPAKRPRLQGDYGGGGQFVGVFEDGRGLKFSETVLDLVAGPGPVWYEPELFVFDANGTRQLTLAKLRTWPHWWDGKTVQEFVFGPQAVTAVGRNQWYHGRADSFVIRAFDPEGKLRRTIRRPFQPVAVTEQDREELIKWRIGLAKASRAGRPDIATVVEQNLRTSARFAEVLPAYSDLIEDADGNLWVEHFRMAFGRVQGPDRRPTRWSVFDPNGRWLGEVEVPASFVVSSITSDKVLGFWQDEFDVEHVRVYALIKPKRTVR